MCHPTECTFWTETYQALLGYHYPMTLQPYYEDAR